MTAKNGKNRGIVFMGTDREINLDQLSSTKLRGEGLWTRDQETVYLERVQRRAEERARAILVQAGEERAALLEEARDETGRMREEARRQAAAIRAESESLKADALRLREEAEQLRAGSEEAGYAAGLGHAQEELEHFRSVMGDSVGALLSAIHAQCDRILEIWKEDLCALLRACVEKGTGLVLDEDRTLLLERLFLDSVRLFEARASVVARVHSDDEAAVADMFAAAKERVPEIALWTVRGDPELAPGDLVLEAADNRVESRIEERRSAVDAALRHILLPVTPEEEHGREELARANAGAVARMLEFAPQRAFTPVAPQDAAVDATDVPAPEEMPVETKAETPVPEVSAETAVPEADPPAVAAEQPVTSGNAVTSGERPVPRVDMSRFRERAEPPAASEALDAVLAAGGFLPAIGDG